jgi:HlyD family secretion protein
VTRRRLVQLGALVLVLAIAVAGWLFVTVRPLPVSVVVPERDVAIRLFGLGTVEARVLARVGFEVGAALDEVLADHGDRVEQGTPLARLRMAEQEARVARAEATVAIAEASAVQAEANLDRAHAVLAEREAANRRQEELARRSVVAAQTAEQALRDVAVAAADTTVAESEILVEKARLDDARALFAYEAAVLDQHELRAPFAAVVVERHVEPGTVVVPGEPVFTLVDPTTLWILAYIDEARAGGLALGQPAELRLRSLPAERFAVEVVRIGLESDRVTEERRVWLGCVTCPDQLYLGEQAEVLIETTRLEQALMVPEAAVSGFDGSQGTVWLVQDGRLEQARLGFGARSEDARLEVVAGLPEGALIVARPTAGLGEGRRARILEEVR